MHCKIPVILVYARLVMGLGALGICQLQPTPVLCFVLVALLLSGLITDIFDGILARRWGVATPKLRRLDSTVDLIFWLCLLLGIISLRPAFLAANAWPIGVVVGLEALTYAVSYVRFRKEIALHTFFAKGWTLLLAATLVQLFLNGKAGLLFWACVYAGILSRLEIIAILCTLPAWATDIPSLYHAVQLRQRKRLS
ncbi:CDP-alcohol phosphatidyltransferase family protein [Hymenobacter sp. YC55]|uniref:CDP-alcohol phosphatidyltransferase family protein n=1 Tax=Hymenobacter sp. YC55 TaxID=3034019 RepID=UPI0023F7E7AB|nr:CDP-alcohol phosphatidyltransferase family protein [Hymenobacter sp. YC55]MDF7811676.1 CDP-alcohol phosphatidyltransferase family protein [Hymenobacter sp. YC55]